MRLNRYIIKSKLRKYAYRNRFIISLLKQRNQRKVQKRVESYSTYGLSTAQRVVDVCADHDITIILFSGSLLGAVREGKFIDYDDDLDLAVVLDDCFSWTCLERTLLDAEFIKVREFAVNNNIVEQAYANDKLTFDVFGLMPISDEMVRCYYLTNIPGVIYESATERSVYYVDAPRPNGLTSINVSGIKLPVPKNSEEILQKLYGSNWRVPDPNWVSGTGFELMDGKPGEALLWLR